MLAATLLLSVAIVDKNKPQKYDSIVANISADNYEGWQDFWVLTCIILGWLFFICVFNILPKDVKLNFLCKEHVPLAETSA